MQMLGPYQIIKPLGEGGMGQVYLATLIKDGGFEKWLALKTIKANLAKEEHFLNLFEKEARMAAMLNHQHIVQIFDFGYDQNGGAYLAMEYIKGLDLREILQKTKIPLDVTLEVMMACAKALDYAARFKNTNHQIGLIHRDISPHNILLGFEGEIKLIDFGLVQFKDSIQGNVEGKMGYMSPEQAYNLPLSPSSDLFSLGIVFYECLSGHRAYPHLGYTIEEALGIQQKANIQPIEELVPDLAPSLVSLIHQLLSLNPLDRYQSASELYEALKDIAKELKLFIGGNSEAWLKNDFNQRYLSQTKVLETAEHTLSVLTSKDQSISITSIISKLHSTNTPEYTYSLVEQSANHRSTLDLDADIQKLSSDVHETTQSTSDPFLEQNEGTQSSTHPMSMQHEGTQSSLHSHPKAPSNRWLGMVNGFFFISILSLSIFFWLTREQPQEITQPNQSKHLTETDQFLKHQIDKDLISTVDVTIDQALLDQALPSLTPDQSLDQKFKKPEKPVKNKIHKIETTQEAMPIALLITLQGQKIRLLENEVKDLPILGQSIKLKWRQIDQTKRLTVHASALLKYSFNQGAFKEFPTTLSLRQKNELVIQKDAQDMIKLNIEIFP